MVDNQNDYGDHVVYKPNRYVRNVHITKTKDAAVGCDNSEGNSFHDLDSGVEYSTVDDNLRHLPILRSQNYETYNN